MLIEALMARQATEGLSDEQFAEERLGISQAYWSLLKNKHRLPGRKFLQQVVTRFPDLEGECLLFLRSGMTTSNVDMAEEDT